MNGPLVSIIVPIYNVEEYLERCIDSIIKQTYKNLEIILVNDGSTDKSGQICEEYAKKDRRIVYISKKMKVNQLPGMLLWISAKESMSHSLTAMIIFLCAS